MHLWSICGVVKCQATCKLAGLQRSKWNVVMEGMQGKVVT